MSEELKTGTDVLSFVERMAANDGAACQSVKSLTIYINRRDPVGANAAERLYSLFSSYGTAMPLERLQLDDAQQLLVFEPRLAAAFAELRTLRTLKVAWVDERAAKMLLSMRSALVVAELKLRDPTELFPRELYIADPIVLLAGSQETLERLTVHGGTTDAAGSAVYERMKELVIMQTENLTTCDLVHAFPNLDTLEVSTVGMWDYDRYRKANQENQDDYKTWLRLKRVKGAGMDVFLLGLRCDVEELVITDPMCCDDEPEVIQTILNDIANDMHPRSLQFTTSCNAIMNDGGVLRSLDVPSLENLVLTIQVTTEDFPLKLHRALRHIASRRNDIWQSLKTFELRIDCTEFERHKQEASAVSLQVALRMSILDSMFERLSVKRLAADFMSRPSLLRKVKVSIINDGDASGRHGELVWDGQTTGVLGLEDKLCGSDSETSDSDDNGGDHDGRSDSDVSSEEINGYESEEV